VRAACQTSAIEDLTLYHAQTPNEEAGGLLRMVNNDLGAEADEREYSTITKTSRCMWTAKLPTKSKLSTMLALLTNCSRAAMTRYAFTFGLQKDTLLTADEEVNLEKR
jgi:hypothetical protein